MAQAQPPNNRQNLQKLQTFESPEDLRTWSRPQLEERKEKVEESYCALLAIILWVG